MPVRRAADPIFVQHLWDSIRSSLLLRQMTDAKRLSKHLVKYTNCSEELAETQIRNAQKDGLIVAFAKPTRTSGTDLVEKFRVPIEDLPVFDGKDWYCFECHLAGDVMTCEGCFRVFHSNCGRDSKHKFDDFRNTSTNLTDQSADNGGTSGTGINIINISSDSDENITTNTNNNDNKPKDINDLYDEKMCLVCNFAKSEIEVFDKKDLNYLIRYVLRRIQAWLPNNLTHTMAQKERPEWKTEQELTWRANQLFFKHCDMSVIEVNLNNESYNTIHEFLAEVLTIQHNVAIFHGRESQEFAASDLMVRDCMHDLKELKLCVDCYRHSNEKINSKWFCLPCNTPHTLVWAKQKGFPYWPAKLIQETSERHFDVRFFGGKHERCYLSKNQIKPIDTPLSQLKSGSTTALKKAIEELRFHQKLLHDPIELKKLIDSSSGKIKALAKQKIVIGGKRKLHLNSSSASNGVNNSFGSSGGDVYDFEEEAGPNSGNFDNFKKRRSSGSVRKVEESTSGLKRKKGPVDSNNVIHISDADEEIDEDEDMDRSDFSFRQNHSCEQVSSSTEMPNIEHFSTNENEMQQLDHPYSDSVEKMRRKLEELSDKKDLIKCGMDCMQNEIDKITNDHNTMLKGLFDSQNNQISETKKKQWCYNCEQEAIYHCCWNTAYCSQSCQQNHWQAEHKKVCRRKR